MQKWKCTVCGYVYVGELKEDFICPNCKQPASAFVKIEEAKRSTTPYAGTKTEKNLWEAFAGESQARNKYTYFASVAGKQGFEQIAELFLKTAANEMSHAKMWFEALGGIGDTSENLLQAAKGENYEWTDIALLKNVETAKVFEKCDVQVWECRVCGHIVVGTKAPEICPVCKHAQSFFEIRKENY